MKQHYRNTRTQYECNFISTDGRIACTIWFNVRKPTYSRMYRAFSSHLEFIREKCECEDVAVENGIFSCGEYTAKMSEKTLLQARGYNAASYT